MNPRIVTNGEIMLRLKSPGFERFFQTPALEATFGGDYNRVRVPEVEALMKGSGSGRVQR